MDIAIPQQRLFEMLSQATMIDLTEEYAFEQLNSALESIYVHTNVIDAMAGEAVRNIIDTEWDKYGNTIAQIPKKELGDNPLQHQRDATHIGYNARLAYRDAVLGEISKILSQLGVM